MKEKIEKLKALNHKAELGGGEDRIAKQHAAGKLTARERFRKTASIRGWRGHRLRNDRATHGICFRSGLHGIRWSLVRDVCP